MIYKYTMDFSLLEVTNKDFFSYSFLNELDLYVIRTKMNTELSSKGE